MIALGRWLKFAMLIQASLLMAMAVLAVSLPAKLVRDQDIAMASYEVWRALVTEVQTAEDPAVAMVAAAARGRSLPHAERVGAHLDALGRGEADALAQLLTAAAAQLSEDHTRSRGVVDAGIGMAVLLTIAGLLGIGWLLARLGTELFTPLRLLHRGVITMAGGDEYRRVVVRGGGALLHGIADGINTVADRLEARVRRDRREVLVLSSAVAGVLAGYDGPAWLVDIGGEVIASNALASVQTGRGGLGAAAEVEPVLNADGVEVGHILSGAVLVESEGDTSGASGVSGSSI